MLERLKATLPLALVIGVLAFAWTEVSLNFTFHWVTDGDLGNGLHLPSNFHLVVVAAFVSWALYFAAGADGAALRKVAIGSIVGVLAALVTIFFGSEMAPSPDFWAISLWVGIGGVVLTAMTALGEWHYVPATFGGFAMAISWWIVTGLDKWIPNGGGVGNSVAALGKPATAGTGAASGVLSTPYGWALFDVAVSLLIGCVLGVLSIKLSALLTPKPATRRVDSAQGEVHGAVAT